MKKSVIIIVLLFGLLVSCSTCSMGNLIQTTDTSFYPEIWKLPERRTRSFEFEEYDSVGLLFPKTIDDKTVVRFNFRYLIEPFYKSFKKVRSIRFSVTDIADLFFNSNLKIIIFLFSFSSLLLPLLPRQKEAIQASRLYCFRSHLFSPFRYPPRLYPA